MAENLYSKFTKQARAGIKGEAFFEALIVEYALPHHIVGSKDLGIDYLCEWVHGDRPTGFLFAVQVKTIARENASLKDLGHIDNRNRLQKFLIKNSQLGIQEKTLQYWRGLGMPIYLFVIVYSALNNVLDCYYKRFTPELTGGAKEECYYKVNDGTTFFAFADHDKRKHGFARDLFIDTIRYSYYKGYISYISPRTIGLDEFPEKDAVFGDVIQEYRENVCQTYNKTRIYLDNLCEEQHASPRIEKGVASSARIDTSSAVPSAEIPEDE